MTAATSVEISTLLNAFQEYTKEQDWSNDKVTKLGLVLAATSIIAVIEYIESWFGDANHLEKGIILGFFILCVVVVYRVFKNKGSSSKETEKRKEKSEDEQ